MIHTTPALENEDDFDAPHHYGETVHQTSGLMNRGRDGTVFITRIAPDTYEVTRILREVDESHRALGMHAHLPKEITTHVYRMTTPCGHVGQPGVPRWLVNGQIPPTDCIAEFFIHKTPGFDEAATVCSRQDDIEKLRKQMVRRAARAAKAGMEGGYSAEQMMEMRNELGRGTMVVNVLTGRKTKL